MTIPVTIFDVLTIGSIMSTTHATHVVRNCIQIIDSILIFRCVNSPGGHIKTLNGEIYEGVNLITKISSVLKPFKMNNKNFG